MHRTASRAAAGDLELFVVDRVQGLARDPALIAAAAAESQRQVAERRPASERELAEGVAERFRLEGELSNVVEAIAAGGGAALAG